MERTGRNAHRLNATLALFLAFLLALPWPNLVLAQSNDAPTFKPEELEQIVAPIALYPDALLAQVLMASTYPLEIVEAARWSKANPKLEGKKLEDALQAQSWDASVKSLTAFPEVLEMMNEQLDWTQKLGDAFLAQQGDVMSAVQVLRNKAKAAGNLDSNEQQNVIVEQPPADVQSDTTIIRIEPASPEVVYVPTYNPTVVYGSWPYPSYPPYSYYPPGYVAAGIVTFGLGMAAGAALWGNANWGWGGGWGGGDVDIDVNRYNNFNRSNVTNNNWQHNSVHRKGVQYRDRGTQDRFGKGGRPGVDSREQFRGRAEQGRQQIARDGGASARRDLDKAGNRPSAGNRPAGGDRPGAGKRPDAGGGGIGDRGGAGNRGGAGVANRAGASDRAGTGNRSAAANRGSGARKSPSAFSGQGSGRQVRHDSNRGNASRQSAARGGHGGSRGGGSGGVRSSGGGGGRSQGGGGGGRGGGGGGRGGGGGGGGRR